jgi:hypothetical protein
MSDLRPLSTSIKQVTNHTLGRKFVALGRILNQWSDIIGPEMSVKTQPVKIIYRKPKDKQEKPKALLEIAATSADASVLHYQKSLILERINQIFGDNWVTEIRFVHIASNTDLPPLSLKKKVDMTNINTLLADIQDEDIRKSLEKLGESVLRKEGNLKAH